jgi:hypothetical protein
MGEMWVALVREQFELIGDYESFIDSTIQRFNYPT